MDLSDQPDAVDFYFDPICPWAYQTSLWMREVRAATGVRIRWRFFSLEEVNRPEGKKHPWEREWAWGWSLMRVGALLRRKDPDLLDAWYERIGRAFHEQGEPVFERERAEAHVAAMGLPAATVAEAIEDPTTHDDVRADHDEVTGAHGAFGVPTLVFSDGGVVFGPNVVPAPTGDEALRLWELVLAWRRFPHLYELRTPKTAADHRHIATVFEPYLRARRWQTIQHHVD